MSTQTESAAIPTPSRLDRADDLRKEWRETGTGPYAPQPVPGPILTWQERLPLCPTNDERWACIEAEIADWRALASVPGKGEPQPVRASASPAEPALRDGATTSSKSDWQLYADEFKVEPENIDYDGDHWSTFVVGVKAGRDDSAASRCRAEGGDTKPDSDNFAAPVVPVDMILHCPSCGLQHIDATEARFADNGEDDTEWTNPPHRSHLSHGCGHIWRPADVATNGVAAITSKGKADSPAALSPVVPVDRNAPSFEELEAIHDMHVGHPVDFAADVLERWGGWPPGVLGNGGSASRKSTAPQLAVPQGWRETLKNIADWLGSSAQIVQNGPDDYGPATEFDYQLGQAANEITAMLAAAPEVSLALPSEELHFNAQRLRNVAKLVGLESAVPQDDATLDGARGAVLGQIAAKLHEAYKHTNEDSLRVFKAGKVIGAAEVALPAAQGEALDAARDVLAERQRQMQVEGWTPEHDDKYDGGELALAAACYATVGDCTAPGRVPNDWPWDGGWWKPSDDRRNLVKAAALILADIERIDRATTAEQAVTQQEKK